MTWIHFMTWVPTGKILQQRMLSILLLHRWRWGRCCNSSRNAMIPSFPLNWKSSQVPHQVAPARDEAAVTLACSPLAGATWWDLPWTSTCTILAECATCKLNDALCIEHSPSIGEWLKCARCTRWWRLVYIHAATIICHFDLSLLWRTALRCSAVRDPLCVVSAQQIARA